ncbi:ran guanine nucleotide release factor-like [Antedon mediterranea]|uniref:ran guanine nucleotide release factor-like n=1 Tax=Antedon mediterranea TaxID=105859 RepID=UPI003AF61975
MAGNGGQHHELYGGAMTVMLPVNFEDVSQIRQVPDNQEVFSHPSTDQSIIIELLEYQQITDDLAAKYHFQEMAGSNEATSFEVTSEEQVSTSEVTMHQCSSIWLLHGKQMVSKFNEEAKNVLNVNIALFRLPQYTTDVLVTFNDPMQINPDSSSSTMPTGQRNAWTMMQFKTVICTLNLIDPSLFTS